MAKDKFSWKSIFFQETENTSQASDSVRERHTIPESKITFPTNITIHNDAVPTEILSNVIAMYEKGFDSLNQAGYDFYEFFKAVMATDPNNPQSYVMAYTMATSMDSSVTKASLLASGQFYLNEISKVYRNYDNEGKEVKNNLVTELVKEKENLQSEIKSIQNQIMALQLKLEEKTKLSLNFDTNNSVKVQEVEQKIMANDLAKDRIIQNISLVISGINNTI
jgi:hypothetical protein